jgi:hypothetical protein
MNSYYGTNGSANIVLSIVFDSISVRSSVTVTDQESIQLTKAKDLEAGAIGLASHAAMLYLLRKSDMHDWLKTGMADYARLRFTVLIQ